MRKRSTSRRKTRARRLPDDVVLEQAQDRRANERPAERKGAFYAAGPVLTLVPDREEAAGEQAAGEREGAVPEEQAAVEEGATAAEREAGMQTAGGPAPTTAGEGTDEQVAVYSNQGSLRLHGRTDADFSSSYRTRNVVVRSQSDCDTCPDGKQIRVTGTLVANYHVTTRVTLPSVSDFPDLTPCQQARVRDAINNVLAPHEQQHVAAFRQYNGTTRRPFDLTICRSEFDSTIESMFDTEEAARRDAAQAASDALDPFYFQVDLDCED